VGQSSTTLSHFFSFLFVSVLSIIILTFFGYNARLPANCFGVQYHTEDVNIHITQNSLVFHITRLLPLNASQ